MDGASYNVESEFAGLHGSSVDLRFFEGARSMARAGEGRKQKSPAHWFMSEA